MSGKNIVFDDEKINEISFYKKNLFNRHDIDANKILVSKKEPYGGKNSFKYFIGYHDNFGIRPLCRKLPKTINHVKCFDSKKTMPFKVIHNRLLKRHTKI